MNHQDRIGCTRDDRRRADADRYARPGPVGVQRVSRALPGEVERLFFLKLYLDHRSLSPVALGRAGAAANCWEGRLRHVLGVRFQPGHRIGVLRNGREIFPAMLDAIEQARHSIEVLFFVFWKGDIAERVCQALIERADAGVRVRVVLDGFGSTPMPARLKDRLNDSAVELRVFHPVPHWKFWGLDARTHRKILVVDGKRGFTGGVGIAEEWTGDAGDAEHFRDTQFDLTGPAVDELRAAFFANWAAAGGALPADLHIPRPHPKTGCRAAVVAAEGAERWSKVALMFQSLTRLADERLDIVTPYFVPGATLVEAINVASRRGVRIRIMVSGRNTDHPLARRAGQRCYAALLAAGVEIHEYDRTLLHTKAVIVDQRLVCIGSPNMNQRSQSLDDEIAVLIDDADLADELLRDFEYDRSHCRAIERESWAQRGAWQRTREWWAGRMEAQL